MGSDHHISTICILAFMVGVMITSYTVIDKVTLQYIPAFTLNLATNIGNLLALTYITIRSKAIKHEWRMNWSTIILGGILAPGGYICLEGTRDDACFTACTDA